jgi:hypothetical protein
MKITNWFSLSCALLRFSNNYFVLRIARYNEYIFEKPIPVAGLSKAWVWIRRLSAAFFVTEIIMYLMPGLNV